MQKIIKEEQASRTAAIIKAMATSIRMAVARDSSSRIKRSRMTLKDNSKPRCEKTLIFSSGCPI